MILSLMILAAVLAFLFSGAEIAFVRMNRILMKIWERHHRLGSRQTRAFVERPEKFLATTLVGNNIAITMFSTLAVVYFLPIGVSEEKIFLASTAFIILFMEILPKPLFTRYYHVLFPALSLPLRFFYLLLLPVILFAEGVSSLISRLAGMDEEINQSRHSILEQIYHSVVEINALNDHTEQILRNVADLEDETARSILTPRTDLVAVGLTDSIDEAMKRIVDSGFSKLPVYDGDIDHVVGYITARDLFERPQAISDILRPVAVFPETIAAKPLMQEFAGRRIGLAIIVDEYGGTGGIITQEDLVEELFGDIQDEFDDQVVWIRPLRSGRWLVNTRMDVDDFCEQVGLDSPEGQWETLGGWLMELYGGIPPTGETLEIEGLRMRVVKSTPTQLMAVKLENPPVN